MILGSSLNLSFSWSWFSTVLSSTPHTAIIVSQLNNWLTFTTSGFNFIYAVILRLLICLSPLSSIGAVIKSGELEIECGLQLLLLESRRNIEPKEIPSCLIPCLLLGFTWELEILVTTMTTECLKTRYSSFLSLVEWVLHLNNQGYHRDFNNNWSSQQVWVEYLTVSTRGLNPHL